MRDLEILLMAMVIVFVVLLLLKGQRPVDHPDHINREDNDGDHDHENERT
jgi:hypothetical protein